mmetsp:Transcript_4416/g.16715  ORF Transcript_4416/g.16715 Transcript_4416/m.16715 type:complete len:424 (-) Transcript_4416:87-1358(-)
MKRALASHVLRCRLHSGGAGPTSSLAKDSGSLSDGFSVALRHGFADRLPSSVAPRKVSGWADCRSSSLLRLAEANAAAIWHVCPGDRAKREAEAMCRLMICLASAGIGCFLSSAAQAEESPHLGSAGLASGGSWAAHHKFRLVALDLDGTLLDREGRISDFTRGALSKVFGSGPCAPVMVIATGRLLGEVPYQEVPAREVYVLSTNGAQLSLWRGAEGSEPGRLQQISSLHFSDKATRAILALAGPSECDAVWCSDASGHKYQVVAHNAEGRARTVEILTPGVFEFVPAFEEPLQNKVVVMIVVVADPDSWAARAKKVLPSGISVVSYAPRPLVGIQVAGVDKGVALRCLCAQLRVALGEAVAFGDGVNDLEMLEAAGCGVAPSNAIAEAKQAADVVLARSNDEDAVARALLELHSGGHFRTH